MNFSEGHGHYELQERLEREGDGDLVLQVRQDARGTEEADELHLCCRFSFSSPGHPLASMDSLGRRPAPAERHCRLPAAAGKLLWNDLETRYSFARFSQLRQSLGWVGLPCGTTTHMCLKNNSRTASWKGATLTIPKKASLTGNQM